MANSSISHRGLSDAVNLFNTMVNAKGSTPKTQDDESHTPFNELMGARQISLLEPEEPGFQRLEGRALADLHSNDDDSSDRADTADGTLLPGAEGHIAKTSRDASSPAGDSAGVKVSEAQREAAAAQTDNLSLFDEDASLDGDLQSVDKMLATSASGRGSENFGSALSAITDGNLAIQSGQAGDLADLGLDLSNLSQLKAATTLGGSGDAKGIPQFHITENALTDPGWEKAMSARIGWMSSQGVHNATLRLNPQELGGIHIQLSVDGDSANVKFQTEHRDTREMIERLMPRLHAAFEAQGIKLEEARVSHNAQLNNAGSQLAQQHSEQAQGEGAAARQTGDAAPDIVEIELDTPQSVVLNSGVDYYA